jgi:DNA-binding response OmpR family regulator
MPGGLSGIDLANWVRLNRPGLEIVLTSGDTRAAEIVADCGQAESFIGKPYDIDATILRLNRLMRRQAR